MSDYHYYSIADLAVAYAEHRLDPATVVDSLLSRIESKDPQLGAFQVLYAEEARRAARASSELLATGHRIGPFHGIPFALKDIIDLEGRITTGGSYPMRERISAVTASIARHLLSAGGILLGKTKTVEVAMGGWGTNTHMGTPWNPWDLDLHRAPGGSSSGSGVSVAAGLASCAVGTDTGGSVRIPAAWNGIVGLKMTEGALPTDGILPLSHTLDTPGPMARSVEDALLMLDAMRGLNPRIAEADWNSRTGYFTGLDAGVAGLRLASMDDELREQASAEVLQCYDQALDLLRAAGAIVEPMSLGLSFAQIRDRVGEIISAEGYYHHGELMSDPQAMVDPDVPQRILPGKAISSRDYIAMLHTREEDIANTLKRMTSFDAFLTPTLATVAPAIDSIDQSTSPAGYTRIVNYLRMCALSVPCATGASALPVGLHIVTRAGQESMSCRIGRAYEKLRGALSHPIE